MLTVIAVATLVQALCLSPKSKLVEQALPATLATIEILMHGLMGLAALGLGGVTCSVYQSIGKGI